MLLSWLYLVMPSAVLGYYRHLISAIGPLYIVVEAAQSVGLFIMAGEKVTDWLSDGHDAKTNGGATLAVERSFESLNLFKKMHSVDDC